MRLAVVLLPLLAFLASARYFLLFDDYDYKGNYVIDEQNNENCWNLNGKGDRTSSVQAKRQGCTTFYRERNCKGSQWQMRGQYARTVPAFLNDHIWSYRNKC